MFKDALETEKFPESVWVVLYCDMLCRFVRSGNFAFSITLTLCTKFYELRVGRVIHGQIVKANEDPDQVVYNALLRLYVECGCFKDVLWVFDEMLERDIATCC